VPQRTGKQKGMSEADLEVMRRFRIDQQNAMSLKKLSEISSSAELSSPTSGSLQSSASKSRSGGAQVTADRIFRHSKKKLEKTVVGAAPPDSPEASAAAQSDSY
jgi:hypothetical protein